MAREKDLPTWVYRGVLVFMLAYWFNSNNKKVDQIYDIVILSQPVIASHTTRITQAENEIKNIQIEMRDMVAVQDRFKDLYKYLEPQRH